MAQAASAPKPFAAVELPGGARIARGDARYLEIRDFLDDEAALLDDSELLVWIELMAEDLIYRVPIRVTRNRDDGAGFAQHMFHLDETAMTLRMKATRLAATPSAWAENPPSRTRRFVANVRIHEGDSDQEYHVRSSILLLRSRYDDPHVDVVSGMRIDVLRREGDALKIARRTVYLDQSTLGTPNLAVFL